MDAEPTVLPTGYLHLRMQSLRLLRFARLEIQIRRVMHDPPFLCAVLAPRSGPIAKRTFETISTNSITVNYSGFRSILQDRQIHSSLTNICQILILCHQNLQPKHHSSQQPYVKSPFLENQAASLGPKCQQYQAYLSKACLLICPVHDLQ